MENIGNFVEVPMHDGFWLDQKHIYFYSFQMGNQQSDQPSISEIFPKSYTPCKIILIGLDDSGKTTFLESIRDSFPQNDRINIVQNIPTIGFIVETLDLPGCEFTSWDICGGGTRIWPLYRHYYQDTDIVMFCVNSNYNDKDRLLSELDDVICRKILDQNELKNVSVLILCNKQDLPNVLTPQEIVKMLELTKIKQPWFILPCSFKNGDGIMEGMQWAADQWNQSKK